MSRLSPLSRLAHRLEPRIAPGAQDRARAARQRSRAAGRRSSTGARRLALALPLVLGLLLVAWGAAEALTRPVPAPGGQLVEGIVGQPRSLNPLELPGPVDRELAPLLFNGLTRLTPSGEVEPDLAAAWSATPDARSFTFTLRPDLRWHDGEPVTARDAVFTLTARQRAAAAADPVDNPFSGLTFEGEGLTVRIAAAEPRPDLPRLLAVPLAPAHRHAAPDGSVASPEGEGVRPVGTGPFRVAETVLDRLTLERNPAYHGGAPYLERYVLRFYPDAAAARAAYARGEVGALWLRASPDDPSTGRTFTVPVFDELTLVAFNTRSGPLEDAAVRRALAAVLATGELGPAALPERLVTARSPLLPAQAPAGLTFVTDGPAELERLGWALGADGIRARAGVPLRLDFVAADGADSARLAVAAAERLHRAGVPAEPFLRPWPELVRDRLAPGRFDLALIGVRGAGDDAGLASLWAREPEAGGVNVGRWRSEAAAAAIRAIGAATGPDELAAARAAFLAAWSDEMPAVPLAWPRYRFLVPMELQGATLGPLISPAQRYRGVEGWYLQTARAWRNPFAAA